MIRKKLIKDLLSRLTKDNTNCNMNAINDFIDGCQSFNNKLSIEELSSFIDLTISKVKNCGCPIDEHQLKRIKEKFGL